MTIVTTQDQRRCTGPYRALPRSKAEALIVGIDAYTGAPPPRCSGYLDVDGGRQYECKPGGARLIAGANWPAHKVRRRENKCRDCNAAALRISRRRKGARATVVPRPPRPPRPTFLQAVIGAAVRALSAFV
jgi:hypothetical protein